MGSESYLEMFNMEKNDPESKMREVVDACADYGVCRYLMESTQIGPVSLLAISNVIAIIKGHQNLRYHQSQFLRLKLCFLLYLPF